MTNKSFRHLTHYVVLLTLMVIGLVSITLVGKNTLPHTLILIGLAVIYFLWGIIHSSLEGELHSEIVMEYLLFGLLGLTLVLGVLYYL